MKLETSSYYDKMAEGYERERHHGYHAFLDDSEVACVASWIKGAEVLEVGCGTGLIMSRLRGVAARVVGVDISSSMLARAKARGHIVVQADATALPFRTASFDAVVCFKVLPHIEDARRALAEMARVLRPGGVLAVEFYNRHSLRGLMKRIKPAVPVADGVSDEDVFTRYDTLSEAIALLPDDLDVIAVHGIRIALPAAQLMRVPVIGAVLRAMERLLSRTPLARFAGFIVVVARKQTI